MSNESKPYFDEIANHLCGRFSAIQFIERFTTNRDVIGAYAEAVVTAFIRNILHPLRVVSGTIIGPNDFASPGDLRQIDAIVWSPNPLPAIMDESGFGLVPRNSVIGALEIKRTDYPKGLDDIEERAVSAVNDLPSGQKGFLGVICVRKTHAPSGDNKLGSLLKTDKAVYLIDIQDGNTSIHPEGVYRLVNYLAGLRKFHKDWHDEFSVNYPST